MSVEAPTAGAPFLLVRLLKGVPACGRGGRTIVSEVSETAVKVHVQALGACSRPPRRTGRRRKRTLRPLPYVMPTTAHGLPEVMVEARGMLCALHRVRHGP